MAEDDDVVELVEDETPTTDPDEVIEIIEDDLEIAVSDDDLDELSTSEELLSESDIQSEETEKKLESGVPELTTDAAPNTGSTDSAEGEERANSREADSAEAEKIAGGQATEGVDESTIPPADSISEPPTEDEEPQFGLGELLALLVDLRTSPHILLLLVLSTILYTFAQSADSLAILATIGFLSLAASYALTAWLTRWNIFHNLVRVGQSSPSTSKLKTALLHTLKAWSIPLILSVIIGLVLWKITSQNDGLGENLILLLAGLFIVWSIGQGFSFKVGTTSWLGGSASTHDGEETKTGWKGITALQLLVVTTLSTLLAYGYSSGFTGDLGDRMKWGSFIIITLTIQVLLVRSSKTSLERVTGSLGGRRFANRWTLLSQLFVTWHLASAWRRLVGDPDPFSMIIEEFALMVITVLMAIWSLASRQVSRGGSLFTSDNALFWGLSFGFGYAGSIAMLTRLTDSLGGGNLATTMAIGHLLTAAAVLFLHRSALENHASKVATIVWRERMGNQNEAMTVEPEVP